MMAYRSAHAKQFLTDILGKKGAAANKFSKIATFRSKTTLHGHRTHDIEIKAQRFLWNRPKEPRLKKAHQVWSNEKEFHSFLRLQCCGKS